MVETISPALSPALAHIIERPRLIERLEEGGGSRVSVFAAPAGYGKTTLARQWGEKQSAPVSWYRTTRASGDVALLAVQFDELFAALAPDLPREPGKVASIASVNPSPKPLGRAILRTFESLARDILIIVDEWEAADTPESDELLSMLVDGLDIRFVITTRERPEWFAPRLEVYGDGLEIGVDELRMTDDEAAEVLAAAGAVAGRARVMRTADGWPAVLGLAAMSGEVDFTSDRLISRTLYEFLASELVASAAPETQEALMLLAVASVVDVDRAQQLLGEGGDAALTDASARGLVAITDRNALFFHPLLRDLLIQRFAELDAAECTRLLGRCRRLFEHRRWDEALSVGELSLDPQFIADAIAVALDDLLAAGRTSSLERWVLAARASKAEGGLIDYAEAELRLRKGEFAHALALGARAASQLAGDLAARAQIVAGRAAHLLDRPDRAEVHADQAASTAETADVRTAANWLRVLAALERQAPDFRERLDEFRSLAGSSIEPSLMVATGQLTLAEIEGGLDEAIEDARAVLAVATDDLAPIAHTGLLSTYAYALIMRCRYQESLQATEALTRTAEVCGLEFPLRYAELYSAAARVGLRQFVAADRALSLLERATEHEPGSYFRGNLPVHRARLFGSLGDVDRAHEVLSLGPPDSPIRMVIGEFLGWQAIFTAIAGERDHALALAEEAQAPPCGLEARCLAILSRGLVAALIDRREARALALAAEAIQTEAWDPILIAVRASPDFAGVVARGPATSGWLRRLLANSSDWSLAASVGLRIPRPARPRTKLSPREQEVYELIAQGLTNEQISKVLFISLSTTKVHVKHIFEKLGVRSRIEAARLWDGER